MFGLRDKYSEVEMKVWETNPFSSGSNWVRADFHLHTKADKEFNYSGQENDFVKDYAACFARSKNVKT